MKVTPADDSLLVDISDALSERDRVRFTVHTRTKLPQFAKPVLSVVRQHEEFIWLHDCLEDSEAYAGYIIPPVPPKPDFDSSRDKLQRLGDGEANMTKDEFAKMKQELEAEYLAIFKKTVAMHEMFLQRLASHEKFRQDPNFKIFLEYENELAVRSKSKKEKLAGSIQNIGKSLTDFVITTSQVAATSSASSSILATSGLASNFSQQPTSKQSNGNTTIENSTSISDTRADQVGQVSSSQSVANLSSENVINNNTVDETNNLTKKTVNDNGDHQSVDDSDDLDEQYFEKERLFLALYHNSIRETAIQAEKVTYEQKCLADCYLYIAQQLVKLASIEILPITAQTKDHSSYVSCPLPSLTMPTRSSFIQPSTIGSSSSISSPDSTSSAGDAVAGSSCNINNDKQTNHSTGGCANDHTSEGLKQLLLKVSDYLEQARKVETRIASDEDLKLTDTFLYYKRETVAAQDLLMRRLRYMSEYETANRNLDKVRQKGRTQMQYADVIQKQAKENFISISKQTKKELIDYKQRRVVSFRKAFNDLVELELKHLRSHTQLIRNCLDACRGEQQQQQQQQPTDPVRF